jgi:hypothetical protein
MAELIVPFALVAVVLMLSGLVSGIVREAPLSVPIIFIGIGLALGEGGLGLLHVGVHDQALAIVGIISLAFVLFLDAVNLRFDEVGDAWRVPRRRKNRSADRPGRQDPRDQLATPAVRDRLARPDRLPLSRSCWARSQHSLSAMG